MKSRETSKFLGDFHLIRKTVERRMQPERAINFHQNVLRREIKMLNHVTNMFAERLCTQSAANNGRVDGVSRRFIGNFLKPKSSEHRSGRDKRLEAAFFTLSLRAGLERRSFLMNLWLVSFNFQLGYVPCFDLLAGSYLFSFCHSNCRSPPRLCFFFFGAQIQLPPIARRVIKKRSSLRRQ
jgi:hypothetical protein